MSTVIRQDERLTATQDKELTKKHYDIGLTNGWAHSACIELDEREKFFARLEGKK